MASPPKPKKKLLHTSDNEEEEESDAVKAARREALASLVRDDLRTPYLTCQRCNSVTFINVNRVRTVRSSSQELDTFEQLPVCSGCGTTKYLRAGVVSFHDQIAEEKQKIQEFEQKRVPATHLLVRIARGFLGRLAFRRRKRAHELYLWRIRNAATRIQARVRGMQARKRTIYERCLAIIKSMHPSLLAYALAARPDHPPVFWYDHSGERQVLFWNYREFVRRAGGKPPLFKVESNILEITKRMLAREHELVSRIQSRWRGLTTRLVFVAFKRQRGWLRSLQQAPASKIQRVVRMHRAQRRVHALRAVQQFPSMLSAYGDERAQEKKKEMSIAFQKKLLHKYRVAYQTTKTAKMLALETKEENQEGVEVDVQHSLRRAPAAEETHRRHPNAQKLRDMKRLVRPHAHGPRLRILDAQAFAREEVDATATSIS